MFSRVVMLLSRLFALQNFMACNKYFIQVQICSAKLALGEITFK